jgi:hypothetical protein
LGVVGSGTGGWEGKRQLQESAAIVNLPERILQGLAQKVSSIATSVGSVPDPAINSAVLVVHVFEPSKHYRNRVFVKNPVSKNNK